MSETPGVDRPYMPGYGIKPAQEGNTCFRVRPHKVIGLDTADFTGSPTRWTLH